MVNKVITTVSLSLLTSSFKLSEGSVNPVISNEYEKSFLQDFSIRLKQGSLALEMTGGVDQSARFKSMVGKGY